MFYVSPDDVDTDAAPGMEMILYVIFIVGLYCTILPAQVIVAAL